MDLYKRIFSQACFDVNEKVLDGFEQLSDDDFNSKTHLFNGRYENLYLGEEKIPGLEVIVNTANEEAAKLLEMDKEKLASGFWLNSMRPGDVTTAHTHDDDDELLSCVYYVRVPKNSGNLIIYENSGNGGQNKIEIDSTTGDFVFFKPDVPHEVTKNNSSEHRLSIAFNFGRNN